MIEVRRAEMADLNWLEKTERENFSLPWTLDMFARMLEGGSCSILVALDGGERAGFLVLSRVLDEGAIDNVCTSARFRRRGVGGALVSAAAELARAEGLSLLTLEVRESNAPALALYKKQSFEILGKRPGYYEQPREDAVIMTLYLKEAQS